MSKTKSVVKSPKIKAKGAKRPAYRSTGGNIGIFIFLSVISAFMILPMFYAVLQSLKPIDEIFAYPPRFFVRHPTANNYSQLLKLANSLWVPFSRYIFNSLYVSIFSTAIYIFIAVMAGYSLAKGKFPGVALISNLVVWTMLFRAEVLAVPQYIVISSFKLVDTHASIILPAMASTMGVFLMKQFMEQLPDSLMESARLDGANEWVVFWKIVMPNVKPAWLTLAIFQFQQMWSNTGSLFLRDEQLKPLQFALQQITAGGVARAGAAAAVTFIIAAVPITFFLICQSNVLETMTTSGMKD